MIGLFDSLLNGPDAGTLPAESAEALRAAATEFYEAGGVLTLADWLLLPQTYRDAFRLARAALFTDGMKAAAADAALEEGMNKV